MQATGTATDPLSASDTDTVTISSGGGGTTSARAIRTSFFENRINWGNSVDEFTQGPNLVIDDYIQAPVGPVTLGHTMSTIINARIIGIRIYKHPLASGTIPTAMWSATGTVLASKTVSWSVDDGGWRTITWDAPISITAGTTYNFGYHYPNADSKYAANSYVWNSSQDTFVYPLNMPGYSATSTGTKSGGSWAHVGSGLTFSNAPVDRQPANYYIDPIVEWDLDTPGYTPGQPYYGQFVNGGSRYPFPVIIWWADPPYIPGYAALGINTYWAGSVTDDYRNAIVDADLDWYPVLHLNDMSAPKRVQEDAALADCVRGYLLTDEPEFNRPFNSPATLRVWRDNCRLIDSTRPILLNMSRLVMENQGFLWQPVGISAKDANLQWREYMSLVDLGSLDCYGINHTYPFTWQASSSDRYGIWIYPLQIHRMRREITDNRMPIFGVVETTSAYAGKPTPEDVKRAVWSMLIAGAEGIEYFDHRFSSPEVTQNFGAMLSDSAMSSAISALNTQMQSLAGPLLSPDASLIESYTSSGTMAKAQGGYPIGAKVPMHYTGRLFGGTTYIFAQSIREGATTATFFAPSLAGAVLTVIGESRTVTIDGTGHFSDTFSTDYAYHLYSTTTDPTFTAPSNTAAPSIATDGTPQTG